MKTTNVDQPGEKSHGIARGHAGTARAGTPGPTLRDTDGNEATNPEIIFNGATVIDGGDGTTTVVITADGGGVIDVTGPLYGAAGDGTTDDTTAIQDAIDAVCAAGGGVVYFPAGTYLISATLTVICDGVALLGDGPAAAVILADPSMATGNMVEITSADYCAIRELGLTSAAQKTGGVGILITSCLFTTVEYLRLNNQYDAVKTVDSTVVRIVGLDVRNTAHHGFYFTGTGNDFYMSQVVADNSPNATGHGIFLDSGTQAFIGEDCDLIHFANGLVITPSGTSTWHFFTGMIFDTNTNDGIHLGDGAADLRGITFVNCWAASNGSQGVYIGANVEGFQFIGGKVLNNGQNGFTVTSTTATRLTIADNLIVSNSQGSSGTYSGIRVVGGVTHLSVTGNHSYNGLSLGSTQKYGLSLESGATDYLVLDGNDFHGNATGEISNLSGVTGTHVHGDDVTHWEPVQFDDGSAEWPFVYLDGQIVMAEVRN